MSDNAQVFSMAQQPIRSVQFQIDKYPLPQQVIDNIETVLGFQAKQEQNDPWHEKLVSRISAVFGRSYFLYAQLLLVAIWLASSYLVTDAVLPLGLPKYSIQDQFLDTAALLIATGVLIRQSRQEKLAEQRSHLILQINLLTEQKTAKIIELLEELRSDLPDLPARYDWEARIMQQSADPQVVLNILQENLDSVIDHKTSTPEPEREPDHAPD